MSDPDCINILAVFNKMNSHASVSINILHQEIPASLIYCKARQGKTWHDKERWSKVEVTEWHIIWSGMGHTIWPKQTFSVLSYLDLRLDLDLTKYLSVAT